MENIKAYTPSSVLEAYNNILVSDLDGKTIILKGIYVADPSPNSKLYGGYYYDHLKDENGQGDIVIKVSPTIRQKFKQNGLFTISGVVNRKVRANTSSINVSVLVDEILNVEDSKITEEDLKKIQLLEEKRNHGYKNVDSIIQNNIYNDKKLKVALLFPQGTIVRTEFENALGSAKIAYEFHYYNVTFNEGDLVRNLKTIQPNHDIICFVRGGGNTAGLELFNRADFCRSVIFDHNSCFVSAVGHGEDKLLFKQLADKTVDTPTALGKYFKDQVEKVKVEKENAKAILIQQVRLQLQKELDAYKKGNEDLKKQLNEQAKSHKEISDQLMLQLKMERDKSSKISQEFAKNTENFNKRISEKDIAIQRLNDQLQQRSRGGCFSIIFVLFGLGVSIYWFL